MYFFWSFSILINVKWTNTLFNLLSSSISALPHAPLSNFMAGKNKKGWVGVFVGGGFGFFFQTKCALSQ